MIGVIVMIGASWGPTSRKLTPRAAMLGTLAGISLTFISMRPAAQMWEAAWIASGDGDHPHRLLHGHEVAVRHSSRARRVARRHGHRLDRWLHVGADVGKAVSDIALGIPDLRVDMLFSGLAHLAPLLGTAIPLGVYNFTEAMSNVESAAAAGDNYNLRSVLLADGAGACIGSAFGSPFPPAVYIGHPAGRTQAAGRLLVGQRRGDWKSSASLGFSGCSTRCYRYPPSCRSCSTSDC